jgi:hypothetical protein
LFDGIEVVYNSRLRDATRRMTGIARRLSQSHVLATLGAFVLASPAPGSIRAEGAAPAQPAPRVAAAIPAISPEVTGPGPMFESLMTLAPGDDMEHFQYEAREFFVSGIADGLPYKTRIVVRAPAEARKASGLVLAESMHPSGNAWMFHFTHTYSMASGHIGLDILTSLAAPFVEFNRARYGTLQVATGQAVEILAQVGALITSSARANPLARFRIGKVILAGTSASAAVLINYLPAHATYARADGSAIYDGFLPTSTGASIPPVDVPMIQVPTMTEVAGGNSTARPDGDEAGNRFRVYEFAGMAHIDTRDAAAYYPDPCKHPISRFPFAAYMSVALDHLWKWIDRGAVPPRAERIVVDRNLDNDGSLMALDEVGNVVGGIRNPYVDVPARKYGVRNEGASPPIPDAHPFVAVRGEAARNQLCGLAGYEMPLTAAQLRALHGSRAGYRAKVASRLDELTRQGWSLPVYKARIIADAAAVEF